MATEKEQARRDRAEHDDVALAAEALEQAHSGAIETAALIEQAQQVIAEVRDYRQRNHFAEKFRTLIRGAA